jgi:hypothetical protein
VLYCTHILTTQESEMATVEGQRVNVGDYVCFKSDVEQCGQIVKITGNVLVLKRDSGFEGAYIGGSTTTQVDARDCWIE